MATYFQGGTFDQQNSDPVLNYSRNNNIQITDTGAINDYATGKITQDQALNRLSGGSYKLQAGGPIIDNGSGPKQYADFAINPGLGTGFSAGGKNYGAMPINSKNMQPTAPASYKSPAATTPPTPPTPQTPNTGDTTSGTSTTSNTAPQNNPPVTLTPEQQKDQDMRNRIQSLNDQYAGKSAYQNQENQAYGVDVAQKTVNDFTVQQQQILNEANQIRLTTQPNAGVTTAIDTRQRNESLRVNAIAALSVSSLLAAAQGQLSYAQSLSDKAVAAKFDPIKAEIDAKLANLAIIEKSPQFTQEEKAQADAQKLAQDAKLEEVKRGEQDSATIMSWAAALAQSNTPNASLISNQLADMANLKNGAKPDLQKAFALYSPYAKDPIAIQKSMLDLQLTRSQITKNLAEARKASLDQATQNSATVQGWVTNIKSGNAKLSDITGNAALKSAVSTALSKSGNNVSDILNTTKQSLNELQQMIDTNHGFTSAVGTNVPNPLGLLTQPGDQLFFKGIPGTDAADFLAKLKQVKNDVILPNLNLLHGLGRVTDREFQALSSAVTALSPDLSEGQFKSELKDITDRINTKLNLNNSDQSNPQPKQINYQGKVYNVDSKGNMTLAQ